jgi:hypothetical protein
MANQNNIQQKIEIARKKGYDDSQIKTFLSKNKIAFSENDFTPVGFLGESKAALSSRGEKAGESIFKAQQGRQSPISAAIQAVGQGAGAIGDIALAGAKAITPEFIEKPAGEILQKTASTIGGTQTAQDIASKYEQFKMAHPEAAANLEATGLIASILPIGAGAKIATKGAEKAAEITAKGALKTASKLGETATGATKFGVKQLSGFDAPTIERIISKPDIFTPEKMAKITPENIAKDVQESLSKRIDELSDTGKEYEAIKKAKTQVMLDAEEIQNILSKEGLAIGEDGKIITTAESVPLSQGDITAIENFLAQYGPEKITTSNAFLNARKALDNLSSWDAAKTDVSDRIARSLRSAYDEMGKMQIPGLKDLDSKYAPEVGELRKYKKVILNPDGSLKDSAISYITNATGANKAPILERLEALTPGLTERIKDLKAVQDVNRVSEFHKVGNYAKGAGLGFVASGMNPLGLLGGLLLSDPANVISALKAFGKAKKYTDEAMSNIITSIKNGKKLSENQTEIVSEFVNKKIKEISEMPNKEGGFVRLPGGKVVKAVDDATKREMLSAIDYIRVGKKKNGYNQAMEQTIGDLADKYGIAGRSYAKLSDKFEDLLEKTKTIDNSNRDVYASMPLESELKKRLELE